MKKLKVIAGLLLAAMLLVTASCGAAAVSEGEPPKSYPEESRNDSYYPTTPIVPAMPQDSAGGKYSPEPAVISTTSWSTDRMIIRTGQMIMVVNDVPIAINQITVLADGSGGYVVSSNVWKSGERLAGTISIRVPADDFNSVIETLRNLAVEVTSESSDSTDVTEEYIDLSAKLENLEATEAQLLTIMAKAETVEDILNVQAQLTKVRGEIEQTKGRMQYLERTSATSLITIQLQESSLNIEFTADKRRGINEGEKVQFYLNELSGGFSPYSYEWDFGDGETSTEQNPVHSYKNDGSYTVSLTVTDDKGNTDTITRENYVTVIPGWSASSVAGNAWNGLTIFGKAIANIFIWIGVFFPLWIIIGATVFGILYWRRRNKKRNAQTN